MGCRLNGVKLGYLGHPDEIMDSGGDFNYCTNKDSDCIDFLRFLCTSMENECSGFAISDNLEMELYNNGAFGIGVCDGREGLTFDSEWTFFGKVGMNFLLQLYQ